MIVNDCKYVVHQDEGAGAYTAIVDNCVIKREESVSSGYGNLVAEHDIMNIWSIRIVSSLTMFPE